MRSKIVLIILSQNIKHRARWLRGNARDSHSGGPGLKSRGRPTWLRFLVVYLKVTRELVIFKHKCWVGPHIPLQMYKFNVSQDLKPLLLTKWLTISLLE